MKLATTTGDFAAYAATQQEAMRYIAKAGFRYLDYNFGMDYGRKNGIFSGDLDGYIDDVKKECDELEVRFVQAHSPMGKPIARGNEAFLNDTLKCVEACGMLGIPNIVVHSGYETGLTVEETFERNREFYAPLLEAAERYDVNILVENFNKMHVENLYWIDNAPDLLGLIEYIDHPRFHAVWDTGHANMQEMPQDEALRLLGKHVYALHVQDNMGNADSHMAPFFGTMNLDSLMHGLIDIGYDGYFTFEAGAILPGPNKRRPFEKDTRLLKVPLELRLSAERFLYDMGKCILDAYGCFEE